MVDTPQINAKRAIPFTQLHTRVPTLVEVEGFEDYFFSLWEGHVLSIYVKQWEDTLLLKENQFGPYKKALAFRF